MQLTNYDLMFLMYCKKTVERESYSDIYYKPAV